MEWARKKLAALATALIAIALVVAPGVAGAQGAIFADTKGTSDKPESKIWTQNNDWWCCISNLTKLSLYRLDTGVWTKKLDLGPAVVPVALGGTCDVLSDGTTLFVAAWGAATSKLYKLTYNAVTDNYDMVLGFPVNITMRPGSETIVIEKDSTGKLWITYEAEQKIYTQYNTTADYKTYSVPFAIGTGVDPDDISSIVSFGGNKIGVTWSDQLGARACFRYRNDSDPVGTWQPLEIIRQGFAVIDDHLNMKADSHGRVFIAFKDFFDSIWLARRNADGTWTLNTGASGLDCGTRPLIQLDETLNKLYLFYTHWETCISVGNHKIDERVANLDDMIFSLPTPVIGANNLEMNNVSGSKRSLPTGSVAILCEGGTTTLKAYWAGWGPVSTLGGSDPGGQLAPPPVAPTNPASAVVTESPSPRVMLCRFDDATGLVATDASGNNHSLTLGPSAQAKNPHWVPGLMNGALFFDGTDYLTASGAPFKFLGSSFTLETWLKPDLSNSAGTGLLFARADTVHSEYNLTLTANQLQFQWSVDDTMSLSIKANGQFRDTFWHHVAAVWDQAAMEARLYIDGHNVTRKVMLSGPAYDANFNFTMGCLVEGARIKKQFAGTLDLAAVTNAAVYNADFVPPLLYPAAAQKYIRLSWTPTSSLAGVVGYRVSRGINGGTPTSLTSTVFNNPWFPDFSPTDGILGYYIRGQDALTQQGAAATTQIRWEGTPPAIPTAPQNLDWSKATASLDGPGFWEMDDGLGSFAKDGTDFLHDARLGALGLLDSAEPHWISSFEGSGLHFDGVNDYCEVADAPELRFATTPFTIEAWVRRGTLTGTQTILSKDAGATKRNYSLAIVTGGAVEFSCTKNGSSSLKKVTSTTLINDFLWHHVACTYNPTGTIATIFIDGAAAGSGATAGPLYTGSESVFFGARTPGSLTNFLNGDLDLVRISNTIKYTGPFTPPQLYRGGPRRPVVRVTWGLPPSGLVLNYHLYRQQLPAGTNTLIGTIPADLPTFPDANATPEVTYRYTVKAMNSSNQEGPASAPLDVTVPLVTDTQNDPPPAAHGPRLRIEPNPFNPQATVRFRLDATGPVRLELYDARGRQIDTLVNGVMPAGMHDVRLVRSNSQARLASGIYFVRLRADGQDTRAKAVLIK